MASKIYADTIGVQLIVDCETDISSATGTLIKYKKPDGTTGEWVATLYGTNYLTYTTIDGDLDQSGLYQIMSYMSINGWTGPGETDHFMVYDSYA